MAAAMLRDAARKYPEMQAKNIEVLSAGTGARSGDVATALAVQTMKRRGIDISAHRAKRFGREDADWADVVLTMTKAHKQTVVQAAPAAGTKTFTIAEYAGADGDVKDPLVEGTEEEYERCGDQLSKLISRVLTRVLAD